jgi:hypothetical protein
MYSINMHNRIVKSVILLFLSFGFILFSDTSAQAQKRYYRYEDDSRVYRVNRNSEGRQVARQYGYDDGFEDGADAGRERDVYNPQNSGDWKKGTNGYEDEFGDKWLYRQAYRSAYLQGYKNGYRRYTDKIFLKNKNVYRRRL